MLLPNLVFVKDYSPVAICELLPKEALSLDHLQQGFVLIIVVELKLDSLLVPLPHLPCLVVTGEVKLVGERYSDFT